MPLTAQAVDTTGDNRLSKVPEVTIGFWIVKILCTTLGETGGDAVTMSMNLGYLVGTLIFAAVFSCRRCRTNQGKAIPSVCLLDNNYCHHYGWNHNGRLCRPLSRHRLYGRKSCLCLGCCWRRLACGTGHSDPCRSRLSIRQRLRCFTG